MVNTADSLVGNAIQCTSHQDSQSFLKTLYRISQHVGGYIEAFKHAHLLQIMEESSSALTVSNNSRACVLDHTKASSAGRTFNQQQRAGQEALNAFTKVNKFSLDGITAQHRTSLENVHKTCEEHIQAAAHSTGNDFAKHYSKAFNSLKQMQIELAKNSGSLGSIQDRFSPVSHCMMDLSRAALIHQFGNKDASKFLDDDNIHDYWIGVSKVKGKCLCF